MTPELTALQKNSFAVVMRLSSKFAESIIFVFQYAIK